MVTKRLENYDFSTNSIDTKLTWVLYIKIPEITDNRERELVIKHLKEKLHVRINETSYHVIEDLKPDIKEVKSKDWKQGKDADMLSFTIRFATKAIATCKDISKYPFDKVEAKIKFELTHFDIEDRHFDLQKVYRFDFYHPAETWLSWKPDSNGFEEFSLDFENIRQEVILEKKKNDDYSIKFNYYPGVTFVIPIPRHSFQPTMNFFLPAVFVSTFSLAAFNVVEQDNVVQVVAIAMLTYVQLYHHIREVIPKTKKITIMERIVLFYMGISLLPMLF